MVSIPTTRPEVDVQTEGLNGRLPNQDLINSFRLVSTYTGGVPVLLYDHRDPREVPHLESQLSIIPSWLPDLIRKQDAVKEYGFRAKNILKHVGYQARGQTNGVHGLLHRYATTLAERIYVSCLMYFQFLQVPH